MQVRCNPLCSPRNWFSHQRRITTMKSTRWLDVGWKVWGKDYNEKEVKSTMKKILDGIHLSLWTKCGSLPYLRLCVAYIWLLCVRWLSSKIILVSLALVVWWASVSIKFVPRYTENATKFACCLLRVFLRWGSFPQYVLILNDRSQRVYILSDNQGGM